jgi:VanZ family protein
MNEQRPAWAWLFFAQLALVVGASLLATTGHFPMTLFQRSPFDKGGHLLVYGALAFFAVAFFGHGRRWHVVIGLLVLATLEELSQRALPRRTFDLGDLAMNIIGISIFGLAAVATARLRRARSRRASTGNQAVASDSAGFGRNG